MGKVFALALVALVLACGSAFAADGQQSTPGKAAANEQGFGYLVISIGFSLAIAAAFGALGQGRAIAASVEAMARQPEAGGRIFTSMIIGLALIETLVIYTLVIAFTLAGKLA
jgi:F-type H+-transporting ATPase subunit c